ncbi:MAG: hypothetical protein OER95_07930 [Acidimicrobiia bacterium]|nr:hypothetical protein [Acidimicrobiia bacterium]
MNVYTVQVTVDGGYYTAQAEDALTMYDTSLGFTTGGGWFYWPGTANPETGYPGDKTNFGYTMSYNKKGTNVKGNLLVIRHLADGTIYRVKSNAQDGLALGSGTGFAWASYTGKATYLEPGWDDAVGNHQFTVYAGDSDTGVDRFWLNTLGKDGTDVALSLSETTTATPTGPTAWPAG